MESRIDISPAKSASGALRIAVLLPCYNEEAAIAKVVSDFQASLPTAEVYVYDNNSSDGTARKAADAGARVVPSPVQGKGHVVQHMFRTIDADAYVMADGDDTYPAGDAPKLVRTLVETQADMVVGCRTRNYEEGAFRRLHLWGNWLFAKLVSVLFGVRLTDILSGYRVFSPRFARTMPLSAGGFGIETDMTLNGLAKGMRIVEVPVDYRSRPEGSQSKLDTWRDGAIVLGAIFRLFKDYKPLAFFGALAVMLAALSLVTGYIPIEEYLRTGLVGRFPLAILAASLGVLAAVMLSIGLILDTAARYHRETFALMERAIYRRDGSRDDQ